MTCGIYILKFKGTDKVYVGLSKDIERRFRSHTYNFKNSLSESKLQQAYVEYGMPSLLVSCECLEEELGECEKEAIEIYNSINNGFNSREGGTIGASLTTQGELNHKARHSKEVYLKVFNLLVDSDISYKDISVEAGCSIQIVDHMSSGVSHRAWLEAEYPDRYKVLISKLHTRQNISVVFISPKGEEVRTSSLLELSIQEGIPKSALSKLNTGELQEYKGWKLQTPKVFNPKCKKEYLLENVESLQTYTFTNVSKFCRDMCISNRKGFTSFLNKSIEGERYGNLKFLSKT